MDRSGRFARRPFRRPRTPWTGIPEPGHPMPPQRRRRFGFWGPVPYFSSRTRRGTDVSVGGCGCCLPIPLVVTVATVAGLRALWRQLR